MTLLKVIKSLISQLYSSSDEQWHFDVWNASFLLFTIEIWLTYLTFILVLILLLSFILDWSKDSSSKTNQCIVSAKGRHLCSTGLINKLAKIV